jgi:hypothetical protein
MIRFSHFHVVNINSNPALAGMNWFTHFPHLFNIFILDFNSEMHHLESGNVPCDSLVLSKLYRCGHEVIAPCFKRNDIAAVTYGGDKLDWTKIAFFPEILTAAKPVAEIRHAMNTEVLAKSGGEAHEVIVQSDTAYCYPCEAAPRCNALVTFEKQCGHFMHHIPCHQAFQWTVNGDETEPRCEESTPMVHPACEHIVSAKCWVLEALKEWDIWQISTINKLPYDLMTEQANASGELKETLVFEEARLGVIDLCYPSPEVSNLIACKETVVLKRGCSHLARMTCCEAVSRKWRVCTEVVEVICPDEKCGFVKQIPCHNYTAQIESGIPDPCWNIQAKLCNICNINMVEVPCYEKVAQCGREVTAKLSCGHAVSWLCGSDNDPRVLETLLLADEKDVRLCKACIRPNWDEELSSQYNEELGREFYQNSWSLVERSIKSLGFVVNCYMLNGQTHLNKLFEARQSLLNETVQVQYEDSTIQFLNAPLPFGSYEDLQKNFRLVMSKLPPPDKNVRKNPTKQENKSHDAAILSRFTVMKDTPYGRGVMLPLLSKANLATLTDDADGSIEYCVGVSFSLSEAEVRPPFYVESKKQSKKNEDIQKKKAKRTVDQLRVEGYDCIKMQDDATNLHDRSVYWVPGVTIPIAVVKMRIHIMCSVCRGSLLRNQGFLCSQEHFLCWDCFTDFAESARAPGSIKHHDEEGNLCCPECKESYNIQEVGQAGPQTVRIIEVSRLKHLSLTSSLLAGF